MQVGGQTIPVFMVPGVGGNVLMFSPLARRLGQTYPVYGLQARGLDGKEAPFTSVQKMASHYVEQIRRVRPNGPYSLLGSCTGGLIAYEMAQQLAMDGENVTLVVMDTWHPSTYHSHRYRLPMRPGLPLFLLWRALRTIPALVRLPIKDWIPFLRQKCTRLLAVSNAEVNHDELVTEFQVERVTRATLQAVARYDVRKYPGRILNIVASERYVARSVTDTRQVWQEFGGEGSKTVKVAAMNAGNLLAVPHVEAVTQHLLAFFPRDSQHQSTPLAKVGR